MKWQFNISDKTLDVASYSTSTGLLILGLNIDQWLTVVGIFTGLVVTVLNVHLKLKHAKEAAEERKFDRDLQKKQLAILASAINSNGADNDRPTDPSNQA